MEHQKITLFSAKKIAKNLQNENAELTEHLNTKHQQIKQLENKTLELETFIRNENLSEVYSAILRLEELKNEQQIIYSAIEKVKEEEKQLDNEVKKHKEQILDIKAVINLQDAGIFDYKNPAEDSVKLSTKLASVRSDIKNMVTTKKAIWSTDRFTFNNSAAKGKRLVQQTASMVLRAYNAEAENGVKAVKAGNLEIIQKRLERVRDQIAKNGETMEIQISSKYHKLRLEEISLTSQYLQAEKARKEQEREEKARLREERKAEQELAAEKAKLEKEITHYQNVFNALQAKGDFEGAEKIQAQIDETNKAMETVDYRVANIKAGYVYIISNIGAFGKNIVKIGMTRRLEPMDRIKELGDASVPFKFDVHALIFSDNAVDLENKLHKNFVNERVNKINQRREFFYTTPEKVLDALKQHKVSLVEYKTQPEAEEYNLSIATKSQNSSLDFQKI